MSVAIVTVAVGDTYRAFLPQWAHAITELDTPPDQVVIVTDHITDVVLDAVDATRGTAITATGTWKHHPQILANEAIRETTTTWVCKMDVDDVIYPHALNTVDNVDADVLMFGISVNGHEDIRAKTVTADAILTATGNLVFAGSPFRRKVWEASNGFQDMLYDDWRFWREAAANGFTFQSTGTIDYQYNLGQHNATRGAHHETEKRKVFDHVH